jgi:hypothetical protein
MRIIDRVAKVFKFKKTTDVFEQFLNFSAGQYLLQKPISSS